MYPFMINGQRAFDSAMAHPWEGTVSSSLISSRQACTAPADWMTLGACPSPKRGASSRQFQARIDSMHKERASLEFIGAFLCAGFSAKVTSSSRPQGYMGLSERRTLGDQLTFEVQGSEYSMSTYRGMNVMVFTSAPQRTWTPLPCCQAGSRESVQTFDTHSTGSEAPVEVRF